MAESYVTQVELKTNVEKVLEKLKETQDRMDKLEGKEYKINLGIDAKTLESVIQKLDKMLNSLGKGTGDFKQLESLSKQLESITSDVRDFSKAFGKIDDSGAKTLLSTIQNIDKSLSNLSQNILNVNKNMDNIGGNTSGAVKQVENITNESKQAVEALDNVAKAQAKVNGGKTNLSSGNSNQKKDAFQSKNSNQKSQEIKRNLEAVAQSENKARQEAIKTDKAINNINFVPNTEGFDEIVSKFKLLREEAEQIVKITKTTRQAVDGTFSTSYTAKLKMVVHTI